MKLSYNNIVALSLSKGVCPTSALRQAQGYGAFTGSKVGKARA